MANTLRFKRGLASGIPTGVAGEPLFTTDTFDLYIGNGTTNTRFQKYIASGATTQILRGDGSLYTFPLAISSPSNGQVLKYNGTSWVNDSDAGITGSGSAGQVAYFTGATTQAGNSNLFWDNTNSRLGIGTNAPSTILDILGTSVVTAQIKSSTNTGAASYVSKNDANSTFELGMWGSTRTAFGAIASGNGYVYGTTDVTLSSGTLIKFATGVTPIEYMRLTTTGRLLIGSTTDSGEALQVTGTMKVTGASSFGGNMTLSLNQNAATTFTISNTTSGTGSYSAFFATSNNGSGVFGKISSGFTTYKINSPNDTYLYNNTAGDISLLNDYSSGNIKFAAGASSTAQMTLSSNGNLSLTTNKSSVTEFSITNTTSGTSAYPQLKITSSNGDVYFGKVSAGFITYKTIVGNDAFLINQTSGDISILSDHASGNIKFAAGGSSTTQMLLNASGNLGLGVTPSAWTTGNSVRALQMNGGSLFVYDTNSVWMAQNMHISAALGNTYTANGVATYYVQSAGGHFWANASSGTANTAATFTTRMMLTALNNLVIGSTTDSGEKLQVTGTAKITGAATFSSSVTAASYRFGSFAGGDFDDYAIYVNATGATNGTTIASVANTSIRFRTNFATRLTIDGSGNMAVDTNTLFVDATNDRMGIGTVTPNSKLEVYSNSGYTVIRSVGAAGGYFDVYSTGGVRQGSFGSENNGDTYFGTRSSNPLIFLTNGTERMRLTSGGNLLIGTTTDSGYKLRVNGTSYYDDNARFPNTKGILFENSSASAVGSIKMATGVTNPLEITNGTNTITLVAIGTAISSNLLVGAANIGTSATNTLVLGTGTAPSSSPTDSVQIYSADITAGNAAPHFRTENGAVIKLYQETTAVGNSTISIGGGNAVLDDTEFDGYTLRQIVKALRNQGILA